MVSANTTSTRMLGIAEDLDVTIGKLRTTAHFFVTERASWDMLIGMPLLAQLNAQTWFESGAAWLSLVDEEGRTIKVRSTSINDIRNRTIVPAPAKHTHVTSLRLREDQMDVEDIVTIEWD